MRASMLWSTLFKSQMLAIKSGEKHLGSIEHVHDNF